MANKIRVDILAKELNVKSKEIIEKCRAEGIDVVKNHMSTLILSAGLHATIREWFSEGSHDGALEASAPIDLKRVRIRRRRKRNEVVETQARDGGPLPKLHFAHIPINGRWLFGRGSEFAALDGAWNDPDVKIVCVTGLGGIGKTSLVLCHS